MKATAIEHLQRALSDLGLYEGKIDGRRGPATDKGFAALADMWDEPPVTEVSTGRVLRGDGTWPWTARIDGEDIVILNARATCFGGSDDPQDSGETASGISTKKNPSLAACSLPMDGRQFSGLRPAERAALDGSPIPRLPWKTMVRVTCGSISFDAPVIDLGPGKRTGNALDLTIAAARKIDPKATARSFEARVDVRILGGAKHVRG
jgi:hypothetical protein